MDDQSGIMGRSLHDRGHSYKQYVMKCTGCELTEHEEMEIMIIQCMLKRDTIQETRIMKNEGENSVEFILEPQHSICFDKEIVYRLMSLYQVGMNI